MRSHAEFVALLNQWTDRLRPVVDGLADEILDAVYTEMAEVWHEETMAARAQS